MARTEPSSILERFDKAIELTREEGVVVFATRKLPSEIIDQYLDQLQNMRCDRFRVLPSTGLEHGSESDLKARKCAICERKMVFSECKESPLNYLKPKELEEYWKNDKITIACCMCIQNIIDIREKRAKVVNGWLDHIDGGQQLLTYIQLKNLQKWGIIE